MNAIIERYDHDAADYQRYWAPVLDSTAGRILDYVESFVGGRDGQLRVLEIGAGTGSLLDAARARWPRAEFVASDGAAGMLALARARLEGASDDRGRISFITAPADAVTLLDESVDLVMSTFVLQLVPDRQAALREALRVLRPGGMVAYLTWLDRDARRPFLPAEEFDEAVLDLEIEEPEEAAEPHAGDVRSGRTATNELRRAGFVQASASEAILEYDWSMDSYLSYKLAYDELALLELLNEEQRSQLERNARDRLSRLSARDFRWHAPVVFARATKPV